MQFPQYLQNFESGPDTPANWTAHDSDKKLFIRHYTQITRFGRDAAILPHAGAWCLMLDFEAATTKNDAYLVFNDTASDVDIDNGEQKFISFWMFVDETVWGVNDAEMSILELDSTGSELRVRLKYNIDGEDHGWQIGLADVDAEGTDYPAETFRLDSSATLEAGQWNHICLRFKNNGSNGEAELFLNGDPCGLVVDSIDCGGNSIVEFELGAQALTDIFSRGFILFDDFRIWDGTDRPRPEPMDKIESTRYSIHTDKKQTLIAEHIFLGEGEIERAMLAGNPATTGGDTSYVDLYDTDRSQSRIERHVARIYADPEETQLMYGREFGPLKFKEGCFATITKQASANRISAWFEISDKLGDEKVTYREAVAEHGRTKAKLFDPELDLD